MVTVEERVQWIRDYFAQSGGETAVIGMSGGKDSLLTALLCKKALGPDRVIGVTMPMYSYLAGEVIGEDSIKAEWQIKIMGIYHEYVNILPAVESLLKESRTSYVPGVRYNLPARIRMAVLYAVAQSHEGGRVACTSNLSEDWVGWNTKYGDSAGDFQPLADMTATEVWAMLNKILDEDDIKMDLRAFPGVPADGLCGKTDEDALGFTYAQLDKCIREGTSGDAKIDAEIKKRYDMSRHKLELPHRP